MGELPSFITEVPEESLSKQPVKPIATRLRFDISNEQVISGKISEIMYTIPEEFVLEITSVHHSIVNSVPPSVQDYVLARVAATGDVSGTPITLIRLDHTEHHTDHVVFGKGNMILFPNEKIRMSRTAATGSWFVTVHGYLIRKSEAIEEFNIV